jgi:hypothetical protein
MDILQLNHEPGDYAGWEQLAVISDQNSFVFILNMPTSIATLSWRIKQFSQPAGWYPVNRNHWNHISECGFTNANPRSYHPGQSRPSDTAKPDR